MPRPRFAPRRSSPGWPVVRPTSLINTCYSLAAPEYGFSIAGVYRPEKEQLLEVPGSGGTSPLDVDSGYRAREAGYAASWFRTITTEIWGQQ